MSIEIKAVCSSFRWEIMSEALGVSWLNRCTTRCGGPHFRGKVGKKERVLMAFEKIDR
jgi:hypothetical protein